jgi:hypothetical protein
LKKTPERNNFIAKARKEVASPEASGVLAMTGENWN